MSGLILSVVQAHVAHHVVNGELVRPGRVDDATREPVWVHCAANWRVSAFVALYGQRRLGWSTGQADELVSGIWEPTEAWRDLASEVLSETGGD